jgi:phosphinothricin acetyltransferase
VDCIIEAMKPEDWDAVRQIYEEGIATGNATFETSAPEWSAWDAKHLQICRLVARKNGEVVGWAAVSPYSSRYVYRGVVEESVYIAASARGQGIGKILLQALVDESERAGLWTLQAGIFSENVGSIAVHKACGFREVGYRERIGCRDGVWRNVVLMERRSKIAGV